MEAEFVEVGSPDDEDFEIIDKDEFDLVDDGCLKG